MLAAVFGATDAKFSITLTTGTVMIRDGVPQSAQCQVGGAFFFINVDLTSSGKAKVRVRLRLSACVSARCVRVSAYK